MKILVLTTTFPRWKNDVRPEFVFDLSKKLLQLGHDVVILAPHDPGAEKFEVMDGLKVYRYAYFIPNRYQRLVYGGGVLPNFKKSMLAKIQAPLLLISATYHTVQIARKEQIDVIHTHWIIPSGLVGAFCKKILGKKHVMTLHGAGLFALEKLPFKKQIAVFILGNTDSITVVSSHIEKRLRNLSEIPSNIKSLSVVPMGVETSLFSSSVDKIKLKIKYGLNNSTILVGIGRLVDKKGFAYCIDAMPTILAEHPNVKLVICGDGPMRNELEYQADKLGLNDKVLFKGHISASEKRDYLHIADILIIPSIVTKSGDTEGLPVVLLEGFASGLPIIATSVGGMNDAIKNEWNGLLIKEKSPIEITKKVNKILNDSMLRADLSSHSNETSKMYDWDVIGKEYDKIIRESME